MAIGLSSIALIGASAALAAVIFKNKEPRIKEVLDLAKFSPEEIEASPQLKIIQNDLNVYLTGVKDVQFHPILLDIMDRYKKPIGYFSKLENKLILNIPYYFEIKKEGFFSRLLNKKYFLSDFIHFMVFISLVFLAINYENHPSYWVKSASLGLSVASGIIVYYWFSNINIERKRYLNKRDLAEYESVFRDYAKNKLLNPVKDFL
ncbi:hypothetical protein ABRQ03_08830 [Pectobacterium jejuense]|uniref:hypothetical protein n=1 Tax=Pectobacterium TaxID=122277 RepID=UPI001F456A8A|nr:hypothetical protein [Pectobacterium polaris]